MFPQLSFRFAERALLPRNTRCATLSLLPQLRCDMQRVTCTARDFDGRLLSRAAFDTSKSIPPYRRGEVYQFHMSSNMRFTAEHICVKHVVFQVVLRMCIRNTLRRWSAVTSAVCFFLIQPLIGGQGIGRGGPRPLRKVNGATWFRGRPVR